MYGYSSWSENTESRCEPLMLGFEYITQNDLPLCHLIFLFPSKDEAGVTFWNEDFAPVLSYRGQYAPLECERSELESGSTNFTVESRPQYISERWAERL